MTFNNRFLNRDFDSFFEDLLNNKIDSEQRKNLVEPLYENREFIETLSSLIQGLRQFKKLQRKGSK